MLTLQEIWAAETDDKLKHCRFPITDEPPHYFCAELTDGRSYCPTHDKKCHTGPGKPWQGLAGMIEATEQSIVRRAPEDDFQPDLDAVVRSATCIGEPGSLMRRT